ncbi:MAG: ABC transporter ATP-binding protein [Trueperaceae bacterium]|nr:ABC transporter ATP-binding protein [Trueperaceae bacterium]
MQNSETSNVSGKTYLDLFRRYLGPQWQKAAFMALLLLVGIGLQLVVPQVLRYFIDTAQAGGATSLLIRAALIYLGVAVINQILGAGATYFGADVGWTATNYMRRDLAEHCLNLDMSFHTARNAGEMIERIDGDVTALSDFFSQFSVRLIGASLLLIGILILLWLETPLAGLALTGFTVLVMLLLIVTRRIAVPSTVLEREASAQHFGFIEERLAGLEDIRANGGGEHAMRRFILSMRSYYFDTRRAWLMRSSIWLSSFGLFMIGDVLTLAIATHLVLQNTISIGTAYLVFQYMLMLRSPIEQITRQLQELQKAAASIGRIGALFETSSSLSEPEGLTIAEGAQAVSFENVSFSYDDKTILHNLNFQLKPGTVLGLLGRTGSGKTTLTRLLFRLYDPTQGTVRLNGTDVKEALPAHLHKRVGMVTQEVQLFHASVRDNLTFFDPTISDEAIFSLLEELGLSSWLATLSDGLDTILSAGNAGLSAGEAQLLAFTRVFLKDPGLVILDEPSSRLDPATEKQLERAIAKLLQGRTAIIIAHRLATVDRADEIMILEDGQILEYDRREKLAHDKGSRFYRLLQAGNMDLDERMVTGV